MEPKFDQYHAGHGAELLCPACDGNHLRQGQVEAFERAEDAKMGLHVIVLNESVSVNSNLAGNPSQRRHGLRIQLKCEQCGESSELSMSQHKGQTYVDFLVVPSPKIETKIGKDSVPI